MNIREFEEINKKVDEIMLRAEETENEFIFQKQTVGEANKANRTGKR